MGNPTKPPSTTGDPCAVCDGILWPAGKPPKFIEVDLWDLVKCPFCPYDPPNGKWWLEQDGSQPCMWSLTDSLYYITVEMSALHSEVGASGPPPGLRWGYFYDMEGACQSDFQNQRTACIAGVGSKGGNMTIYWPGP